MNDKTLKPEFIDTTLKKIKKVMDVILEYHGVDMEYSIDERNALFCEIIKKSKKGISAGETFDKIQTVLHSNENMNKEQSEWLSQQIYEYHRDIFLLHYFYAVLYSYNYDAQIRKKITEEHVQKFFYKANDIYKKYKDLIENPVETT